MPKDDPIEIKLPADATGARIDEWWVKVGERVSGGDSIGEFETDDDYITLDAPRAALVVSLCGPQGDKVPADGVVAVLKPLYGADDDHYPFDADGQLDTDAYWRRQHSLPLWRRDRRWWTEEFGSTALFLAIGFFLLVYLPWAIVGWYGLVGLIPWGVFVRYGLRNIGVFGPGKSWAGEEP